MPYLYRSFSENSPILGGSFAENDLQLTSPTGDSFLLHDHVVAYSHVIREEEWILRMPYLYRSFSENSPLIHIPYEMLIHISYEIRGMYLM